MEKNKFEDTGNGRLLVLIRISGMVKIREEVQETLNRLRLRRKYSCVLVDKNNKNIWGMIKKVRHYIAYGEIEKGILEKLIKERSESLEGRKKKFKFDEKEIASGLMNGRSLISFKLKPFFRLHPPRKGIRAKLQYPDGVLGDNKKDINKLIERML
jgi:large subunit ribosomal protein L30